MQVTITSGGIAALCAALTLIGIAGLWTIKAIVAGEIRKLNGRYLYAQGSNLTGHEIERRLGGVEEEIRGLRGRHIKGAVS